MAGRDSRDYYGNAKREDGGRDGPVGDHGYYNNNNNNNSSREYNDGGRKRRRSRDRNDDKSDWKVADNDRKGDAVAKGSSSSNGVPAAKVVIDYGEDDDITFGAPVPASAAAAAAAPPGEPDYELMKVQTTVTGNGEISMSVEETNRVRALLGLKPLAVGKANKEQEAIDNMRQAKEEQMRQREADELAQRVEKARERRELKEKIKGQRLGEVQKGEEAELLSAADWVKRSRQVVATREQEKALAAKRARELAEQEVYDDEQLKGLKVAHGAENFEHGDSFILTLKDSNILDTDEHGVARGLADADDELENVTMAESDARLQAKKRASRAKLGAYVAYDDGEFEVGETGREKTLLSQYNEEKKHQAKLVIGTGGVTAAAGGAAGIGMKDDDNEDFDVKPRLPQSLSVDRHTMSEYYTAEEMAAFKKPKKVRKKKKVMRKRELGDEDGDDVDQLGDGERGADGDGGRRSMKRASAASIEADILKSGGGGAASADHGSRTSRASRTKEDPEEAVRKGKERYEKTAAKASEKAAAVAASSASTSTANSGRESAKGSATSSAAAERRDVSALAYIDDLDSDLHASLERARRLAQLKDKMKAKRDVGSEITATIAVYDKIVQPKIEAKVEPPDDDDDRMLVDGGEGSNGSASQRASNNNNNNINNGNVSTSNGMVFTETTEFATRLHARLEEKMRLKLEIEEKEKLRSITEADSRKEVERLKESKTPTSKGMDSAKTASAAKAKADKEAREKEDRKAAAAKKDDISDDDGYDKRGRQHVKKGQHGDAEENDEDEGGDEVDFLLRQPEAKTGMAAALALFSQTGRLKGDRELSGRAKDEKNLPAGQVLGPEDKEEGGVTIQYRDEFGRALTRKEAFRQLNYHFHGFGPGKKKKEKRMKILEEERKRTAGGGDFNALNALQAAQAATKKPFLLLSGGGNLTAGLQSDHLDVAKESIKKKSKKSGSGGVGSRGP